MSPCRCRADDTSLILKLREKKTSKNINNNNKKKEKERECWKLKKNWRMLDLWLIVVTEANINFGNSAESPPSGELRLSTWFPFEPLSNSSLVRFSRLGD